ncbi:MAG TPA: ATP-binding protein [Candidatus Sulfomarinibacteraceae bacterium]|nr:ATP-binding protein [Candidatus Sulfomarinibacteraceae bacterium]
MSQAPDPAHFEELFQKQLRIEQERSRERLASAAPHQALLWLALAPGWSVARAEACKFPSGNEPVAGLFQRLVEQGLAETVESALSRPSGPGRPPTAESAGRRLPSMEPVYLLRAGVQSQVLAPYEADASGQQELLETLGEIGRRLSALDPDSHHLPEDLRKWAYLAAVAPYEDELAYRFEAETERAAEYEDAAELLAWIEIARPLADRVVRARAGAMRLALERAARRLELLHRRRVDLQHLTHFLERAEQLAAFDELLDDRGDAWALHYIGAGGVGKTMLIRHLKANVARERDLAVARIDFDYLNPDYPRLAPGLLLWAFAQELFAFDETGRGRRYFSHADESLSRLHEELRAGMTYNGPVTSHPLFQRALAGYLDALRSLPGRLLLIVDTCEELAKVHTGGQVPENVTETFRILEALHDGLPDLRVIFAGRRPLAHRGAGWRCPAAQDLPERPYLRLHEIRGFPLDEAERYLREDLAVPPHLVQPILRRSSPDAGSAAEIIWEDEARAPRQGVPRCNPYDLRLFADWALEERPPTAEMIASASGDQYVELRIIQRLHNLDLEDVLPVIALLGHIDRNTLQAVLGSDAEDTDRLFHDLLEQEWTDYRVVAFESGAGDAGEGDGTRLVIDVERGMQRRLLAYFQNRDGSAADGYRQRAIDFLEQRTLHDDLGTLDWSDFDATIRLLDSQPERAMSWWSAVEKRILDRGYTWAANLLQYLQAEGAAAGPRDTDDPRALPESPLRPAVLATYAAATLHTASPAAARNVWSKVAEKAEEGEDEITIAPFRPFVKSAAGAVVSQGRDLETLRHAGSLVAASRAGEPLDLTAATAFLLTLDPDAVPADDRQTLAALVAGVEAILDTIDRPGAVADEGQVRALLERSLPRLRALAQTIDDVWPDWPQAELADTSSFQALAGRALSLVGRALAYLGNYEQARQWFGRALRETPLELPASWVMAWYHWLPPTHPAFRIRLEATLALHPALLSAREALEIADVPFQPRPDPEDADIDRVEGLYLQLQLALGTSIQDLHTSPQAVDLWQPWPSTTRTLPRAVAPAHRAVPAFSIVAARYRAAQGGLTAAWTALEAVDPDLQGLANAREAARARLALARRWRLPRGDEVARRLLADSSHPTDLALIWAHDAYRGQAQSLPRQPDNVSDRAGWLHAVWRTRRTARASGVIDDAVARDLYDFVRTELVPAVTDDPDPNLILDLHEVNGLARLYAVPAPTLDPAAWWRDHPQRPEDALRMWLRARVLRLGDKPWPDELPARLGLRRAATMALEEAEFLALRLPGHARDLFQQARVWFRAAEDPVGVVLAGTGSALTLVSQQDQALLQEALDYVREGYEQLPTLPPPELPLPSWQALEEAAVDEKALLPQVQAPVPWQPWLARLLVCLRAAAGRPPYTTAQLALWLGDPPAPIAPDLAHAGPSAPQPRSRIRRLPRWLIALALVLLLLVLAVFFFSGHTVAIPPEGELPDDDFTLWLALLLFIPIALYLLYRSYRLDRDLSQTLVLDVTAGGDAPTAAAVDPTPVRLALSLTPPTTGLRRARPQPPLETGVTTPGPAPYAELAGLLTEEMVRALRDPRRRLSLLGRTLRRSHIPIRAQPPLHAPAWEAALAAASHPAKDPPPPHKTPFHFLRELGDRPDAASPQLPPVDRAHIVRLAPDASAQSLLEQGWQPLLGHRLVALDWINTQAFAPGRQTTLNDDVRILHLLGHVREGSAGLYLDPAPDQQFQLKESPAQQSAMQQSAQLPSETIDARLLRLHYPALALCILQAPAEYTLPGPRTDTDRMQAMLARAFAAELRQAGAAVLVIPPLPHELGAAVIADVARTLRHSLLPLLLARSLRPLPRAVHRARRRIYDHYQAQHDDPQRGWELAYDLCLFAGPRWNLGLPWLQRLASALPSSLKPTP